MSVQKKMEQKENILEQTTTMQKKKDVSLISVLDKIDIYQQFKTLNKRQQAEFINSLVHRSVTNFSTSNRKYNKYRYHLPVNGKRIRATRQLLLETLKIDVQTFKSLHKSLETQSSEVSSTMNNVKKHHEIDHTLNKYSAKNNVPIVALSPRVKLQKMPDFLRSDTMDGTFATPRATKIRIKPYETPKRMLRSPVQQQSIPYYMNPCDNYAVYETPKKRKTWIRTNPETNVVLKLTVDSWTQTKPSVVIHPTDKQKRFVDQAVQTVKAKGNKKLIVDFREETMTSINVKRIHANPLVFIGVPTISWLERFSNNYNFIPSNVLIVLFKIRHNDTLAKLALDFDKSEREILEILHSNVPLMYTIMSSLVNWESLEDEDENEDEGIPHDLKVTFANLKSILKVIHVRVGEDFRHFKFFISVLPSGQVSFVSEAVEAKESNERMFIRSNFMREAPTNCAIIMEEELEDVEELLKERGFTVYVKRKLEQDDFSCNVFLQRDIAIFCNKVKLTFARFMKFKVMEHFVTSEFEDLKGLQLVATIVAAMVNLHFYNDRNLELQIDD